MNGNEWDLLLGLLVVFVGGVPCAVCDRLVYRGEPTDCRCGFKHADWTHAEGVCAREPTPHFAEYPRPEEVTT